MTSPGVPAFIADWHDTLAPTTLSEVAPDPASTAIFSADMINGFVHFGPLASPNVRTLVNPVVQLFTAAHVHGVRDFVLVQDTHSAHTPEFRSYPPHCLHDSPESETIPELESLSFAAEFTVIRKNALNPAIDTGFDAWLEANPQIDTAIVVGDCTDLCTYQLAMHLRMWANARNVERFEVIVPASTVATFDIPAGEDTARGAAHPAAFFHQVFLYHMAQNGIQVATTLI